MLVRVAARVMAAVLVAATVQAVGPSAHAALAAPVLSPTDGSAVDGSDLVVTATYDDVVGSTMALTRITVLDTTHSRQYPCQDEVFFGSGNTSVRCHVRGLAAADYHATAVVRTPSGTVVRTDSWTFTVSTPTLTTSWPAQGQVLSGTAVDPAPGPGAPITLAFDEALAAGSTARLYATSGGLRTAVAATTSAGGSTLSVEPAQPLTPGEYVVASDAVSGASGAHTPGALSFVVGDPVTIPAVPLQGGTLDPSSPEAITLLVPTGAVAGLVVYDPSSPATSSRTESFTSVTCPYATAIAGCVRASLPVGGLAAGDYHWYADVRVGSLTASSPDRELTLGAAAPSAASAVSATAPQSPADPAYVHVTGTVDSATAAVLVTARRGLTTSRTAVTAAGGAFDAWVRAIALDDGDVSVDVVPYDATGRAGPTTTTVTPKESVPLAVAQQPSTIGPHDAVTITFTERVRPDGTLGLRTAQGAAVPGEQVAYSGSTTALTFYPAVALTSQTYQVDVTAYAATCPAGQTATCEKVVATVPQLVDATPPADATSVVVTPRVLSPTDHLVRVTGDADAGATVVVRLGSLEVGPTRGAEDGAGRSAFDTGQVDVAALPRALLPVSVVSTDAYGNARTTPAGSVERRWPTSLSRGVAPTSIPWGTTTTISGRLLDATSAKGIGGRPVTVEERRDDGTVAVVGGATTSADGTFARPVVLTRSGVLRARFPGTTSLRPALSTWSVRIAVGARGTTPTDHPDTLTIAKTRAASPQGVVLVETLRSSADEDWYSFGVQDAGYHLIRLGHLPVDDALSLYDRAGRRLAVSNRSGKQFEELYRYLPAGTYFVHVSGSGSATPYHLRFFRVPDRMTLLSHRYDANQQDLTVELLNNTAQWREPGLPVSCVTASGRTVRQETWVGLPLTPPRSRRPYSAPVLPCPAGSAMHVGAGSDVSTRRAPTRSFSLRLRSVTTERFDRRYLIDVTNHDASTLRNLTVFVEEYDTEGNLIAFGSWTVDPVAAGGTRRVEVDVVRKSTPVGTTRLLGATLV